MSENYAALARIYRRAGFTQESERLRARLFDRIQSQGWLGRRILDLGCGVGETACWFTENGFRATGVDQSSDMLAEAQKLAAEKGLTINWQQGDLRQFDADSGYDLALCLNTLNEIKSIRDMEAVFQATNRALAVGKTFVFDLLTIQGLAEQWGNRDRVLFDDPDNLIVIVRSRFSFESSANTRAYIIYRREGEGWHRDDETHVLRGYAMQAIGALLQRMGFKVQDVISPTFEQFDPYNDQTGRAIFIAVKENAV